MLPDLWRASRPFSWINTGLPFLALAWSIRHGLTLPIVLGTLYFLAPYNLLLYGVNDLFDYESDRRNPRKGGAIEGGLIAPARSHPLWLAIVLTNGPLLAALTWLGGPRVGIALLVTVLVALAYSVPPVRTKVIPGPDSATSSLHFVLPSICGGLVAGGALGSLPGRYLLAFFLWGMASQALGAIQDVRYDRQAGIGSIAVSLGARATALFALLAYGMAVVLVGSLGGLAIVAAIALLPYVLLAASCLSGDAEMQARRAWHGFLGMNLLTGFFITQVLLRAWGADGISVLALLAWGGAVGLLAILGNATLNERSMRRRARVTGPWLAISAIIPARNEEATIASCIRSVRAQHYEGTCEVIVVDDGSTDRTGAEAQSVLGAGDRLLQPGPAPSAWTGKCWAIAQGTREAGGDIFLFLDADTTLVPGALSALAAELRAQDGGLLSILTRYRMESAAERILIPAFALMQLCFLPLAALNATRRVPAALGYAYGPCMMVSRTKYESAGGHRAIQSSDREDVDLGKLMARSGHPVRFLHGADLAATRHYRSLAEVEGCWRRTYYAYGGHSLAISLFGMLGITAVFLLPLILPFVALALGDGSALAGSLIGIVVLSILRIFLALQERQPLGTVLWHPVTWLGTLFFQALGVADGLRGRSPWWRGRSLPMEGAR